MKQAIVLLCCLVLVVAASLAFNGTSSASLQSAFTGQSAPNYSAGAETEYLALTDEEKAIKKARRKIRRRMKLRCARRFIWNSTGFKSCVNTKMTRVDGDEDGIRKKKDNCPDDANYDQADQDGDDIGDVCDDDTDTSV